MNTALNFAVILPSLLVAHNVADHWVQTSKQAANKGSRDWVGRRACALHVLTYTIVTSMMVGFVWSAFGLTISIWGFVTGQVVSAVTHYWADRRFTLEWLADMIGQSGFHDLGVPRQLEAQEYVLNSGQRVVRLFLNENGSPPPIAWDNPSLGTGKYALDQSWHWAWLFVAAVTTVLV
jgi:Protein of unknown function (DUF3307)